MLHLSHGTVGCPAARCSPQQQQQLQRPWSREDEPSFSGLRRPRCLSGVTFCKCEWLVECAC